MARHPHITQLHALIRDSASRKDLASAVGSSPDYLYQVATGRRRASPDLASKIEAATAGAVSKESLIFGDLGADQPARRKRKAA